MADLAFIKELDCTELDNEEFADLVDVLSTGCATEDQLHRLKAADARQADARSPFSSTLTI
jgi:hypothetical protein